VRLDGSGLTRISKAPGMHTVDFRDDRGAYVDRHSDACTPPAATLRVSDANRAIPLTASDFPPTSASAVGFTAA